MKEKKKKDIKFRKKQLDTETNKSQMKWVTIIFISSFLLSIVLTLVSDVIIEATDNIIVAFFVLLAIIVIGIFFDIIGSAVIAADAKPLYAMASRKIYGAKLAIKFLKNADKMASICNDIIGDICGVISGTAVAYITTLLALNNNWFVNTLITLSLTGFVSSLIVGGKAIGKSYAIKESDKIIYRFAVFISIITFKR